MTNNNYHTSRDWLRNLIESESDVILCHDSALEYIGLFNGYLHGKKASVYSKIKGHNNSLNYFIIDPHKTIDTITDKTGIKYTSLNQTVNDMLAGYNKNLLINEQALAAALANYYHSNGRNTFYGIDIYPENIKVFEDVFKDWAIEFYDD